MVKKLKVESCLKSVYGMLLGFDITAHPFTLDPAYR